jgi:hypothetical protein
MFQYLCNATCLNEGGIPCYTLQQMHKIFFLAMNTRVGTNIGYLWTPRVCYECRLLHSVRLPKFLPGTKSVGVNHIFYGIPQVQVRRIEVW